MHDAFAMIFSSCFFQPGVLFLTNIFVLRDIVIRIILPQWPDSHNLGYKSRRKYSSTLSWGACFLPHYG